MAEDEAKDREASEEQRQIREAEKLSLEQQKKEQA